jgi:4a-hydroxytetrahydrobiopterin dehydratase
MAIYDYNQIQERLQNDWTFNVEKNEIEKEFIFADFTAAIDFIDEIAEIAEAQDHHPNLFLHDYKNVLVSVATHAEGGITSNDFQLAAEIDKI